ncbi:hypothetical protein PF008_g13532 [Phytophthora fragariae]|uniref:Uncharacterized protein n=1 Tax=Phytophthora fragariae TaxID=53985 RepID=A0A6G0RK50_9STRA|nr:hypothetical protein PF008_g13532 [Phytophthora fragariae]
MMSGYAFNTFGKLGSRGVRPFCVVLIPIKISEETLAPQEDFGILQTALDRCQSLDSVVMDPIC